MKKLKKSLKAFQKALKETPKEAMDSVVREIDELENTMPPTSPHAPARPSQPD